MFEFQYDHVPDVDAYLERICYTGDRSPTLENLHKLVYLHQIYVPFESLNCSRYHLPVTLSVEDIFRKVVTERRGGYCFELNGLFVALLRDLGYDAVSVMCRLCGNMRTFLSPVRHRASLVTIEGKRYFCDVGYGGAMAPFAVEISEERQTKFNETYWVEPGEMGWFILKRKRSVGYMDSGEGEYEDRAVTIFGPQPFLASDFDALNASTSAPDSNFSRIIRVSRRLPGGYRTVLQKPD